MDDSVLYKWLDKLEQVIEANYMQIDPDSFGMNEIIDGFLYLGDYKDSKHHNISKKDINYVLHCCSSFFQHNYPSNIKEHSIDAADSTDYNIVQKHSAECIAFVDQCRKQNGRCLIHCFAGVNRSVTMTVVYLMHYYPHYTLLQSIEHVVKRRPSVLYNKGFRKQLILYAHSLDRLNGFQHNDEPECKENEDISQEKHGACLDSYQICKQLVVKLINDCISWN
eukprot:467000_1